MNMRTLLNSGLAPAVTAIALLVIGIQTGRAEAGAGDVYVMTNQASGNSVMVFHRDAAGALTRMGSFATGGNGAGTGADPLGSQGALVLSDDQRFLFGVNAGSNSVFVFAVSGDQLSLLDTAGSGGLMPVSVAVKHGLVYVLNAGGTPNISGFAMDPVANRLLPIQGSTRTLPGGAAAAPAEVSFTPDGNVLAVTEKGTNHIDTFVLDGGIPGLGGSFATSGVTPFGFAFGHDDVAIVSDASGGAAGASSVSSYTIDQDGNVVVISPAVGDTQTAACWLVLSRNGRFAYAANAGSGTISSYSVSAEGKLALLDATAGSTGNASTPTDMALSGNGRFLYVRDGGNGSVSGFRIGVGGVLTPIGTTNGVPAGAQGIAAR